MRRDSWPGHWTLRTPYIGTLFRFYYAPKGHPGVPDGQPNSLPGQWKIATCSDTPHRAQDPTNASGASVLPTVIDFYLISLWLLSILSSFLSPFPKSWFQPWLSFYFLLCCTPRFPFFFIIYVNDLLSLFRDGEIRANDTVLCIANQDSKHPAL